MGQSVKELLIRLNGEVGAGMSQIGDSLTQLGYALDKVGRKVREFEKESVNIYRSYEDEMLAAKYAMSAQVDSATELERQMKGLDEAARKWASTTIFHTDDVSKAINEAAHAGWTYQEMLEGIPEAMLIAQAGGLDLSNGLDYLIKMMNATRTPMSDMGKVVDQWAMAANISATNIDELGEAFISMGAAAQFGDSTAELFSLLAAMANVGTTGTKAGTALRNTMMRLIAPTTKAEAAMDLLGADAEELQEVLSDTNVTKAAKTLEGLGFSAFDATTGKLKPIKQIFSELFTLTEGMNEAAKDELLAAIFPTRTIATALSLLTASNGELDEIYNKVVNSEGYAQKGADIMMSGLTGSIETLKSKWEEFERKFGETLAPHIEKIADALGNVVDGLNNLDPAVMSGLASMLTTLGAAGPILIGVGAISKLVGLLGPLGTLALVAGLGVSFLFGYLSKLDQLDFESKFGTLELDVEELNTYVDSLSTKFDKEQEAITKWQSAVSEAQKQYEETVGVLNEGLLKKVLTGGEFTDKDFEQFKTLGENIVKYTQEGIENAETRDLSLLNALFGQSPEDADTLENLSQLMDYNYQGLYDEAYQIGENIRLKMTEALGNGELTAEDRAYIQAQIDRLNAIQAEIAAGVAQDEYYAQLEKASRVSLNTIDTFLEANSEKQASENARIDEQYDALIGRVMSAFERARKNGDKTITYTDLNGEKQVIDVSKGAEDKAREALNAQRAAAHASASEKYGHVSATAFDALMRDSDFGEAWSVLKDYYAAGGEKSFEEILGGRSQENAALARTQLENLKGRVGKLKGILNPFADNPEIYAQMRALELLGNENLDYRAGQFMDTWLPYMRDIEGNAFWTKGGLYYNESLPEKKAELEAAYSRLEQLQSKQRQYEGEIANHEKWLAGEGRPLLWNEGATRDALYGREGGDAGLYAHKEEVDLDIESAEQEIATLEAEIEGMETQKQVVMDVDATKVDEWVPPNKNGWVFYRSTGLFANGGRADQASVFGEAGPEWAIPEQHSERTAELLNAARRASGFTWGDLISRFGGLNANPNNSPVVLNYSPVINANDTSGVAGVLAEDKDRVMKMIRNALSEAKYRESVEAYA